MILEISLINKYNMTGLTEKIRAILNKININEPPVPIEKVAELFSIKVIPYPSFPDNVSGTIIDQKGSIVIGVNSNHHRVRQRFTTAHELGHFLANHDLADQIIDDVFDRTTDKETEANKYAAELLMPKDLLEKDVGKKMDIPQLAKRYDVSEQAISIRLLDTGLINKM